MSIQHSDISDSDRHEAKGASSAAANTVCIANGDGTTSFGNVSYNDLLDQPEFPFIDAVISGVSTSTSQLPSALDTAIQISFGPGGTADKATIDSSGNITLTNIGPYYVRIGLNFGRTSGTGVANLMVRALLNGSQIGQVFGVSLDDNASMVQVSQNILVECTAGDVLTFELVRASSGINNGGLYKTSATTSGWSDIPSAFVEVSF